jgi:hypothetical protein
LALGEPPSSRPEREYEAEAILLPLARLESDLAELKQRVADPFGGN